MRQKSDQQSSDESADESDESADKSDEILTKVFSIKIHFILLNCDFQSF